MALDLRARKLARAKGITLEKAKKLLEAEPSTPTHRKSRVSTALSKSRKRRRKN